MGFVSLGDSLPSVEVSVDFENDPTSSTRTWTDITPQVRSFRTDRGRQYELDRFDAGVARLLLDNRDGRFDPTYEGALTNLWTNPSAETDATGWSGTGATTARVTTEAYSGTASVRCITNGAVGNEGIAVSFSGWTAGATYTVSVYLKGAGSVRLYFSDGVGNTTSSTITLTSTWTRYSVTRTLNGAASELKLEIHTVGAPSAITFYADALQWESGSSATTYTDGSLDNCRWSGAAHASTSYRGGPYYPNVLPTRRIRIRAQWSGVTYNIFHGYIDEWPQQWPDEGFNATVEITASDALKILGLYDLAGKSYAAQLSGARMGSVLTDAGFGTSDYSLDAGQSAIVASGTLSSTSANSHLQDVASSENGGLFVDRGGTIVFQDRHHRITEETSSAGTIGDGGGEIGYSSITTSDDDGQIWNVCRVTPSGGTAEEAVDASSTARHYPRVLTADLLISSQTEARDAAYWRLARFKDAALRIPSVTIIGAASPSTAWPALLALEMSNRVTVKRRRPVGGTISADEYVEAISHDVSVDRDWATELMLSPASSETFWVLEDPMNGVLDSTTRVAY